MTGNVIHHSPIGKLAALALCAIWFSAAAFAQSVAPRTPSPKANLMIERNRVRFELQGETGNWQIEVFNKAGDLIFGSGVVNNATLEWTLEDQQGRPIAGGLYSYILKFWNENNESQGTQRGHVIIDRADTNDRIWATSDKAVGVGASAPELTVTGLSDSTVGGAKLAEVAAPAPSRVTDARPQAEAARASGASTEPQQLKSGGVNALGVIVGDGTAGRIAKFIGANAIDNSVMTESNGRIAVSFAAAPQGRLHVQEPLGPVGVFAKNMTSLAIPNFAGAVGVHGESSGNSSMGVRGVSTGLLSLGVYGNGGHTGVYGVGGIGVQGESANGVGVRGVTDSPDLNDVGVHGRNDGAGNGVFGEAQSGTGVAATSATGFGLVATTGGGSSVAGVLGSTNANHGRGVIGRANNGASARGVTGESANGTGVYGGSSGDNSQGVYGMSVNGVGVRAYSENDIGLVARSDCYACAPNFLAGYFVGNVAVTGNLSKGGGSFKIDHPLDPANKYLYHSFVESPDMMNIYNGNVTTDANGEAAVALPDYFEALNRDYRYQLTVIGQFAQAIVAERIQGRGVFKIKTDKPNVEVSWQVTGVRKDAFAEANRIPVEEAKPERERGYYLHPKLFGQSEERDVEWARHPELMRRMKAERESRRGSQH
jgi:hypothetical protein